MTKKKIILISPLLGIYDSVYKTIPLSLLSTSKNLDFEKYDVIIIDQKIKSWKHKLKSALNNNNNNNDNNNKDNIIAIGITCITGYQIYFARQISKYIKKENPLLKIIWGGIHPTVTPKQTLQDNLVDIVIIGEGENVFPKLINALDKKRDLITISNIGFKDENKNIIFTKSEKFSELKEYKKLPYELIDVKKYLKEIGNNEVYIEGARGCIFNCTFCYNKSFNKGRWRPFSAENLVKNIEFLYKKFEINNFFIIDDSFLLSIKRVKNFIKLLKIKKLNIRWSCEANLSLLAKLDQKTLKELEEVGLNWISIGIESGSLKIRKYLQKHININELIKFNKKISHYDINLRYNFMTGFPIETKKDIKQTINLSNKLLKDNKNAMIQPLYITVPLPGTKYLSQCEKHGFRAPKKLNEWESFDPLDIANKLPWLKNNKKTMAKMIMHTSFFIDKKLEFHLSNSDAGIIIKILTKIYRPIARFRFNNLFYHFYFEGFFIDSINNLYKMKIKREMKL